MIKGISHSSPLPQNNFSYFEPRFKNLTAPSSITSAQGCNSLFTKIWNVVLSIFAWVKSWFVCEKATAELNGQVLEVPRNPAFIPTPQNPKEPILNGYGEFIVYSKTGQAIAKKTYEKVYDCFLKYHPVELATVKGEQKYAERHTLIGREVKQIDPQLEIAFVPRTLVELMFIRETIDEDLKRGEICRFAGKGELDQELNLKKRKDVKDTCWHLMSNSSRIVDFKNPDLVNMSYRLNNVIVNKLKPNEGMTWEKIDKCARLELDFLKNQYREGLQELKERNSNGIGQCTDPGTTTNFRYESTRGSITPMGIDSPRSEQIVLNAVALECSEVAKRHLLLYRGSNFENDSVEHGGKVHSLSFGAGLFGGCMFDGGATPFHFMRTGSEYTKKNAGYVIPVRLGELSNSPFYSPKSLAITDVLSHHETFHARTKFWNGATRDQARGYDQAPDESEYLHSNLTKEQLINSFNGYKQKAIHIK